MGKIYRGILRQTNMQKDLSCKSTNFDSMQDAQLMTEASILHNVLALYPSYRQKESSVILRVPPWLQAKSSGRSAKLK